MSYLLSYNLPMKIQIRINPGEIFGSADHPIWHRLCLYPNGLPGEGSKVELQGGPEVRRTAMSAIRFGQLTELSIVSEPRLPSPSQLPAHLTLLTHLTYFSSLAQCPLSPNITKYHQLSPNITKNQCSIWNKTFPTSFHRS